MAVSAATRARRAAMHALVRKAVLEGRTPIAGVDEAGAGALAGPVVAAAVMLDGNAKHLEIDGLDDSKRITRRRREILYELLMNAPSVSCSVAMLPAQTIDEINILNARLKAMANAVNNLPAAPKLLYVDGDRELPDANCESQHVVIGGDGKISIVAAASIIAKVERDRLMVLASKQFPGYGFEKHLGYGTKLHVEALALQGPCDIHRQSYKPVRDARLNK